MFARLFLIFILVPLADLVLLLMLARLSIPVTVAIILGTGLCGAYCVRRQGTNVLDQLRRVLDDNKMPTDVLIEGALVLFAAALLITPGLMTDLFGFSLLLRPCRRWYQRRLVAWLKKRMKAAVVQSEFETTIIDAKAVARRETKMEPTAGREGKVNSGGIDRTGLT